MKKPHSIFFPPNTVTTNYKSYFLPLQSVKHVSPAAVKEMIFFSCSCFPKELCISVCKLLHAKSTVSNPNVEVNPLAGISAEHSSCQQQVEEMGERRGVKLPWLQSSPLNCNFPYFSRIREEGSSTLSDLWLQRGLTQIASSTLLAAHQARCLFCISFVLWVLIMDMKGTAFICTHRFLIV